MHFHQGKKKHTAEPQNLQLLQLLCHHTCLEQNRRTLLSAGVENCLTNMRTGNFFYYAFYKIIKMCLPAPEHHLLYRSHSILLPWCKFIFVSILFSSSKINRPSFIFLSIYSLTRWATPFFPLLFLFQSSDPLDQLLCNCLAHVDKCSD